MGSLVMLTRTLADAVGAGCAAIAAELVRARADSRAVAIDVDRFAMRELEHGLTKAGVKQP